MKLSLTIDEHRHTLEVDGRKLLLEVLREDVGIASVRAGCHTGDCGACTVRLDGAVRKSCLVLAASADGAVVETVSARDRGVAALKESFIQWGAFQCGFCTPGMLLVSADLLSRNPDPTEGEIRHALSGNLCRCTGYDPIIAAVIEAAAVLRGEETMDATEQIGGAT